MLNVSAGLTPFLRATCRPVVFMRGNKNNKPRKWLVPLFSELQQKWVGGPWEVVALGKWVTGSVACARE